MKVIESEQDNKPSMKFSAIGQAEMETNSHRLDAVCANDSQTVTVKTVELYSG